MALRTLVFYGNPILRQKAKKIHRFDASLPQLIQAMFETMRAHEGIGLAAPQIGLSLRVFVVECTDRLLKFFWPHSRINPGGSKG